MIDNIEKILPLLNFESSDDFYYLQLLQRKKENPELGSNSRVIKNYYITSEKYLLDRYEEIKSLCTLFNARAMLRLNKRSFEKVGFKALENIANTMQNREYNHLNKSYDRACGLLNNEKTKRWILDVDEPYSIEKLYDIDCTILKITDFVDKIITCIPSKNGFHIICTPFNLQLFKETHPEIEVCKDNPTNLFCP